MSRQSGFGYTAKEWERDSRIRMLELAVRMILMELARISWQDDNKGFVTVNGQAVGWEQLARAIGCAVEDLRAACDVLMEAGLLDIHESGAFFLPDIVRAGAKSSKMRANAKMRFADGDLFDQKAEQTAKNNVKSITSARVKRGVVKKEKRTKKEKNNNIYIYILGEKIRADDRGSADNPLMFDGDAFRLYKREWDALRKAFPDFSYDAFDDLIYRQDDWLMARGPRERANWLALTLALLKKAHGGYVRGGDLVAA